MPWLAWLAWLPLATAGDAGGSTAANLRLGTATCGDQTLADCRWLDLQDLLVVDGWFEEQPSPAVTLRLEGRLRLHPVPDADEVDETERVDRIQPWTLEVPEAWIELREVLSPALDLRLGQQRFAWGTGLGMNPVDVVNPYDLRDPTRFDRRLGIPAASAVLHHGQASLELVWAPLFRPARMPAEIDLLDDADQLFDFSEVGGGDLELGQLETRTTLPDGRLGFQSVAARAHLATPVADLGLVGYYGRDSLPQVGGVARLVGFVNDQVEVGIPVRYPRLALVGLEARAPLFLEIGGWAEGAVVFPEQVTVTASRPQLEALVELDLIDEVPDPLPETVIQDGRPYGRWVVGVDRFIGRFSLNLQWIHGLPTERQRSEVRDYAALGVLVTVADPVQLRLQGITDARGWLSRTELVVLHRDAATITVGATLADGPAGSTLEQLRGMSHVHAGVEAAF